MNRVRGFTLIELIVVLSILAVLAATAAPKFFDLQKEARKSALNGLRAAVASAAVMANGLATAQGFSGSTSVTVEGSTVTQRGGYPTGDSNGILQAIRYDTGVYSASSFVAFGSNPIDAYTVTFQVRAATTPSQCAFVYQGVTGTAVSSAYVGTPDLSGC